jgi:3-deoxy-D-manno-octulosonate 8-phosphate phosphatase (KDO 8-P phosphatase)
MEQTMKTTDLINTVKKIKCLICDIDGVLTDGLLYLDNHGNELKSFNVQDGMGLKLLMAADIKVAVITTATNAVVDNRMRQLGIQHYFKGQVDKRNAFVKLKAELNLTDEQFAYIGDDIPDLAVMQQVGFSVAVANAVDIIKKHASWETEKKGGFGAVRELCDLILNTQQLTTLAIGRYFDA